MRSVRIGAGGMFVLSVSSSFKFMLCTCCGIALVFGGSWYFVLASVVSFAYMLHSLYSGVV